MNLLQQLVDVRLVMVDADRGVLLAWFGGHMIHAYTETGDELSAWSVGDFEQNHATRFEVISSMEERIAQGEYPA